MAKITRALMKIFGSTATTNQRSVVGSLAAAAPAYSTDPTTIQSLPQYLSGWFATVIGSNSPAIEDMNSLCFLFAYQLAYLMQAGIPEWQTDTTYYTGSVVNDGTGKLYVSVADTNTGQTPTSASTTWWRRFANPFVGSSTIVADPTPTIDASQTIYYVDSSAGAFNFTLPAIGLVRGAVFTIVDIGGRLSANPITVQPAGGLPTAIPIQGVTAGYFLGVDYGSWIFVCNGSDGWRLQ